MTDLDSIEAALREKDIWYMRGKYQIGVHCPECEQGGVVDVNGFHCLARSCNRSANLADFLAGKTHQSRNILRPPEQLARRGSITRVRKKFTARIGYNNQTRHLGTFETPELARAAIDQFLRDQPSAASAL